MEREARERVLRVAAKSTVVLASAHEETENLVRKIALFDSELVEVHQAHEVVEETACSLSNVVADVELLWEEFERMRQEQFEELTLLQTWGSELCFAIVGPPRERNHLLEGMQIAALHHTKMARELAMLRTVVPFVVEFTLGCSPNKTFWVEVVDELVAKILELEERRLWLECPGARIYDLLLGMPSDQAQLVNSLDVSVGQLGAVLAAWWEADAELEALQTSVVWVQNLVLDWAVFSCSISVHSSGAARGPG
jgi:hypothetical protein